MLDFSTVYIFYFNILFFFQHTLFPWYQFLVQSDTTMRTNEINVITKTPKFKIKFIFKLYEIKWIWKWKTNLQIIESDNKLEDSDSSDERPVSHKCSKIKFEKLQSFLTNSYSFMEKNFRFLRWLPRIYTSKSQSFENQETPEDILSFFFLIYFQIFGDSVRKSFRQTVLQRVKFRMSNIMNNE